MRWIRDAGWLVAVGAVIVIFVTRPERKPLPSPAESRASLEKMRADFEEKRAKREAATEQEISRIRTETTLDLLRSVGREYRRHLMLEKAPPRSEDFAEALDAWRSHRDDQPFTILWGIDLRRLPDGADRVLAWEQKGIKGTQCVLMADGKTAKVVSAEDFAKLPRAK